MVCCHMLLDDVCGRHVHRRVVVFAVENVEVVGGSDGHQVVLRVPARVQDLFGEVEIVHVDFVSIGSFGAAAIERVGGVSLGIEQWRRAAIGAIGIGQVRVHNALGLEQLSWLALLARALKHGFLFAGAVERFEEIVVRTA